ncbi:MAG: HAMP domain-containing histidine kinase [Flavobacteriaceae bacterium]|nr:HAMP domain-containing histidine kinase [Flavobacteriaceae bacterium]
MSFSSNKNLIRWAIILASFIIISLILWNTYIFSQNFKAEERKKMETWSFAQTEFVKEETDTNLDLTLKVLNSNTTTPMVVINTDGSLATYNNIKNFKDNDSVYVNKLIAQFKNENNPIEVFYKGNHYQTLYYGNSPLLNKLKYYPLALLLIILLFAALVYFYYSSSRNASQNKLWSGMAKETAHQIGTPLSSLVGWAELLKLENVKSEYLNEIYKDINRLQTITDRFSKIGSVPTLEKTNLIKATQDAFDYLEKRSSNHINFNFSAPEESIYVMLNTPLFSWTIENLVKNAIDAMKGKGNLDIEVVNTNKLVRIHVSDTGKGIPKQNFKKIFDPGYTSRKRGWGLGLSLAKRIIEDYHNGRIKVKSSTVGKGTTMEISLNRL